MGISMACVEYLASRGCFRSGRAAVLDIGSQCLYHATPEAIRAFADANGAIDDGKKLAEEARRVAYFSTPRPGERTSYLSELFDLTGISYTSYDVCLALKTELFDLNFESVPAHYREKFDLVLNFGTTEHVINQMNSFKVVHDALAIGGVAYHQLPSTGWVDHGYFCYHLPFFKDLAAANGYEMLDHWYTPTGATRLDPAQVDLRDAARPGEPHSAPAGPLELEFLSCLVNVVIRKKVHRPFRVALELATAHSGLAPEIAERQTEDEACTRARPSALGAPDLSRVAGRELARELGRRIKRRLLVPVRGRAA